MQLLLFTVCIAFAKDCKEKEKDKPEEAIRGVNLGGWLALQPWITPSVFKDQCPLMDDEMDGMCPDEWNLHQSENAEEILEKHYSTFITEVDFKQMKIHSITHVCLPIGYWAFKKQIEEHEPYMKNMEIDPLKYVHDAMKWAKDAGIKILIDLHGAPGSQNGFASSGHHQFKGIDPDPQWHLPKNVDRTLSILKSICDEFKEEEALWGVSLIHEIWSTSWAPDKYVPINVVKKFYVKAYDVIRKECGPDVWITFDAAANRAAFYDWEIPNGKKILMDHHNSFVFDWRTLNLGFQGHLVELGKILERDTYKYPHIVGEWSGAETDCVEYLNDVQNKGKSRWTNTFLPAEGNEEPSKGRDCYHVNDPKKWTKKDVYELWSIVSIQTKYYCNPPGAGFFFFTWKTEELALRWNLKWLIEEGFVDLKECRLRSDENGSDKEEYDHEEILLY